MAVSSTSDLTTALEDIAIQKAVDVIVNSVVEK